MKLLQEIYYLVLKKKTGSPSEGRQYILAFFPYLVSKTMRFVVLSKSKLSQNSTDRSACVQCSLFVFVFLFVAYDFLVHLVMLPSTMKMNVFRRIVRPG